MNLKFYLRGLGIGIVVTAIIMLVLSAQNKSNLSDAEIRQRAQELGMIDGNTTLTQLTLPDASEGENDKDTEEKTVQIAQGDSGKTENADAEDEKAESKEAEDAEANADAAEETAIQGDTETPAETEETTENETSSENEATVENEVAEANKTPTEDETSSENETAAANETSAEGEASVENEVAAADETSSTENVNSSGESITFRISSGEGSYEIAKHLADMGLVENATKFDEYLCRTGLDRRISTGSYSIAPGTSEEDIAKKIAGR